MSLEHEAALIASVLISPNVYYGASDIVDPQDFAPSYAAIWRACGALLARNVQPDPITVARELGPDQLEAIGGRAALHGFGASGYTVANWRAYAEAVHETALTERVRRLLHESLESGLGGKALLDHLQERVYRVERPRQLDATWKEAAQQLYDHATQAKPAPPLAYPWVSVQRWTRGMRAGWMCVLAGEPGHGKTAAALEVTDSVLKQGKRVLYVSLEMEPWEIVVRFCQRYGLDSSPLLDERPLTESEHRSLARILSKPELAGLTFARCESVGQVALRIRRYQPDLVVLDHLQLTEVGESRYEGITRNSRDLKVMAGNYQVPILVLSQLNRSAPQMRRKPPSLDRLRESGAIEADANTVTFVWRERDEKERLQPSGLFLVEKSRMGQTGACRFHFDAEQQRFLIEEPHARQPKSEPAPRLTDEAVSA